MDILLQIFSMQQKSNIFIHCYSSIVTPRTSKLITIAIKLSLNLILCQWCETHVFGVCLCFGGYKNYRRRLLLKSFVMKDNCYMLLLCLGYPKDTAKITHIFYLKNRNFTPLCIRNCTFLHVSRQYLTQTKHLMCFCTANDIYCI